ncbi:hypothetical protein B0H65DRAFT_469635 [Neurospora tetraspora]|uniref:Uncharacterized protein n=1 Tax=Neurospora tetraspora TaxID=94610 RepID=A0AAE0MRZ4_9PEZI|nr:hypothetical protein B0H65DRAFT_469635 [Neurospora tetraspora]
MEDYRCGRRAPIAEQGSNLAGRITGTRRITHHGSKTSKGRKKPLATPIRTAEPNEMHYTDDKGVEHSIYFPQPIRTAEPNEMTYTDDKGVEHSIYLPQGTMHTAYGHLQNKRWDELAKFEPYSKYTPTSPPLTDLS